MSSDDQVNSHTIFAIISGLLFTISEILPFISKIESNGLIHFLVNAGNQMLKKKDDSEIEPLLPLHNPDRKKKRSQSQIEIGSESEHSEQSEHSQQSEHNEQSEQSEQIESDRRKGKFKKIKQQIESESESKQIDQFKQIEPKQLEMNIESDRLKTSEEYELEFLKNHIKTHYLDHIIILPSLHKCNQQELENNGYKIFYDHIDDKYTLKW